MIKRNEFKSENKTSPSKVIGNFIPVIEIVDLDYNKINFQLESSVKVSPHVLVFSSNLCLQLAGQAHLSSPDCANSSYPDACKRLHSYKSSFSTKS